MGCVCLLKCERKCLFSCLHFERISDFLFSRVFCNGYVMMANFSWRHYLFIYIYIYIYLFIYIYVCVCVCVLL